MPRPEIEDLVRQIEESDPDDVGQQNAILMRICDVRQQLRGQISPDLVGYLDAAALLTQYLTKMGDLGPRGVLSVTARLMRQLCDSAPGDAAGDDDAPEERAPHRASGPPRFLSTAVRHNPIRHPSIRRPRATR